MKQSKKELLFCIGIAMSAVLAAVVLFLPIIMSHINQHKHYVAEFKYVFGFEIPKTDAERDAARPLVNAKLDSVVDSNLLMEAEIDAAIKDLQHEVDLIGATTDKSVLAKRASIFQQIKDLQAKRVEPHSEAFSKQLLEICNVAAAGGFGNEAAAHWGPLFFGDEGDSYGGAYAGLVQRNDVEMANSCVRESMGW